jgi:hypothetical protein
MNLRGEIVRYFPTDLPRTILLVHAEEEPAVAVVATVSVSANADQDNGAALHCMPRYRRWDEDRDRWFEVVARPRDGRARVEGEAVN